MRRHWREIKKEKVKSRKTKLPHDRIGASRRPANLRGGLCYEKLGGARAALAENEKSSVPQRISDWSEARSWYGKGAELFSTLRDRGMLMPADSEEPKNFSAKIRECDDAIAHLKQ